MIYDLIELSERVFYDADDKLARCTTQHALLAIAERLEALVEEQKPRLVKLEVFDPENQESGSAELMIDPYTVDTIQASAEFLGFVCIAVNDRRFWYVKDALPEVLARLRGDA